MTIIRRTLCTVSTIAMLVCATAAFAEEPAETSSAAGDHAAASAQPAGPVVSADASWATATVIVIGAMFAAAWLIGPIVRANAPQEVPPSHSHDEPPGTSGHHGKSGTVNPEPDHGPAHH